MKNTQYTVDGHDHENVTTAALAGDGQHPPFHIFIPEKQDYLPGSYRTRAEAQYVVNVLSSEANFNEANMETAMCLWEAMLLLRGSIDRASQDDERVPLLKAVDTWFEDHGTSAVRHTVLSWADECEGAWEADRLLDQENEPYDWEHCPLWLEGKLKQHLGLEPGPKTEWRGWKFEFTRAYSITEGFTRIISAPTLAEATAAAERLAQEFNHDCPDDCSEFEGGMHDGIGSFETTCTSAEVHKASEPDYVVTRDGQTVPYES